MVKKVRLVFYVLCVVLFVSLFAGCATTGFQRSDAELIAANSRAAGRLESTVEELDGTIENSRERIELVTRASEKIESGIDRLEYLFSEYEREVSKLLAEIDRIRGEIKAEGKADTDGIFTASSFYPYTYSLDNTETEIRNKNSVHD